MEARPGVYEPTFSRYFLDQLAKQRQLPYRVDEALLAQEALHIQRYLRAAEILERGKGLLRGWAGNPETKLVEARATLQPLTPKEFFHLVEGVFPPFPFKRSAGTQMRLRYRAYERTYPQPDQEELTFVWAQGRKLRHKITLDFLGESRARAISTGDGIQCTDFEAMVQLAQAINFFSAEGSRRERVAREDWRLGGGSEGILITFKPRPATSDQAA